jgi:hypothetical protein
MVIHTTTDPMTLHDVPDPQHHPRLFEGNAEYGLEIFFESEQTRQNYLALEPHDPLVLEGNDAEDYIAEG